MINTQRVWKVLPVIAGVWSLITAVLVLVLLSGPISTIEYVDRGLVISGMCSVAFAAGAVVYHRQNRRAALGFVAGMIGWATVFLGLSMMNRGILGSSLVSLVPAGLMLLGTWYFDSESRQIQDSDRDEA